MSKRPWSEDELLAAFRLWCAIPSSRLDQDNPAIIETAGILDRPPDEMIRQLAAFQNPDDALAGFGLDWEELAVESDAALSRLQESLELFDPDSEEADELTMSGPVATETDVMTRVRLVQEFFRDAVLAAYENRCAMCDIDVPELLAASHIIPWSVSVERRADPSNGICLCALHDRAFDRGLIGADENYRIIISKRLRESDAGKLHGVAFSEIDGAEIRMPSRFPPDQECLKYHVACDSSA